MLKVCNVKLSFGIWLVLYMYFILYSWQQNTKGKQWIQDKEVFLYKHYEVDSSKPKTSEPTFIQDEIVNLEKYMKFM